MPKPISRRDRIRRFKALGWTGPKPRGSHMATIKGQVWIVIPNPHRGDIDWSLTSRILRQAGISREEWESVA